jgi:hypothetical protein
MTEWKNYTKDRLIFCHPEGFFVIKPSVMQEKQPLFCPLCDGIMRSSFDESSYEKFKCCDSCATFWAYPNKAKWLEGWRPSPEEVQNKYKIRT